MSIKLEQITQQYSKFSDNQVLTKKQLNTFLDYFDDQDRLSRVSLNGVGIVCGFRLSLKPIGSQRQITLSQGVAVTTDGDLLRLTAPSLENATLIDGEKQYTHFKLFEDNQAGYRFFRNGNELITMHEVFPSSEALGSSAFTPLSQLSDLENKVGLLYVENYSKTGDICSALDCDNQGVEQMFRLRLLLVSTEDAAFIAGQDPIYSQHSIEQLYKALPHVLTPRDIITEENTQSLQELYQVYQSVASPGSLLENLKNGLNDVFTFFGLTSISPKIDAVFNLSANNTATDFQYRYDAFKDLVDTYNEAKEFLLHSHFECCPSVSAFPKHILLGALQSVDDYTAFRHKYYATPVIGRYQENYNRLMSLLQRADHIVTNYLKTMWSIQ